MPADVTVVKMIQVINDEIGGKAKHKSFKVRRAVVLNALKWLKANHSEYGDIEIVESNLGWLEGKEDGYLTATIEKVNDTNACEDIGPAPKQCMNLREQSEIEDFTAVGIIGEDEFPLPSMEDTKMYNDLKSLSKGNNINNIVVNCLI